MTITTSKAAQVARFLRNVAHPRRTRRVIRYLRSLMVIAPAVKIDRFFARQGLALPRQVKRLDHRGRAAQVIAERQKLMTAMLRGEVSGC
jgi:hypothetical protein